MNQKIRKIAEDNDLRQSKQFPNHYVNDRGERLVNHSENHFWFRGKDHRNGQGTTPNKGR